MIRNDAVAKHIPLRYLADTSSLVESTQVVHQIISVRPEQSCILSRVGTCR